VEAEKIQSVAFEIIVNSGDGRNDIHEAFKLMRKGGFTEANNKLEDANDKLVKSHKSQTDLLKKYASGEKLEMDIIMVHAQDHLMTTMTLRETALEMMEIYKELEEVKSKVENQNNGTTK